MRVLLLNPPARTPAIRDYYCSKHTKSNYLFPPIDLLMQSGIMADAGFEVGALDATVRRLSVAATIKAVERVAPDAVLGMWGAATNAEDREFYRKLDASTPAQIFISGEVALEDPAEWLGRHPFIKGALLRLVSTGLRDWLASGAPGPDLWVRDDQGRISGGLDPDPPREFRLGRPRHELFNDRGYRFSFAHGRDFAVVLSDFGCPFPCRFCVMSTLGHRVRPVAEVAEEWRWLRRHGYREAFLTDQCFGAARRRSQELCAALAEVGGLGFTTFTRADLLDPEMLAALQSAGCHTLIMGVESAAGEILAEYRKELDPQKVEEGFRRCREAGIRTVATFIIGLPEDTEETIRRTMALARRLDPDFVSYNVAVPRAGTGLRQTAAAEGLDDGVSDPDQAGDSAALRTRALSREQVAALKRKAVRDFYLRREYLLRRIRSAPDLPALLAEAREGLALLRKNF